jgi:hypothetical protein
MSTRDAAWSEGSTLSIPVASHTNDAIMAIQRAEAELRKVMVPEREAVQRELVAAATSLGRVLHLTGGGT